MTSNGIEDPKVIAIKLSSDLQERILSFPFLHAISEKYPKAELHLITPREDVEILNLLPFKAFYHLFDETEIKSIFDVHPYTANARLYNVDMFINLTNSFVDACLGLGLRAKKRIGFSDNWKTLVLNVKTNRPIGHHITEDFFTLFELACAEKHNSRLRVTARNLQPIIEGKEPYIAFNISPLRDVCIDEDWTELISYFEGQKIVLFASDDQVNAQMLMEAFIAKQSQKNILVNFIHHDWIELGRMLAHSRGLVSYSGACAAAGAYVGAKTLILYDNEDPQRTGPFYFLTDVCVMAVNNPAVIESGISQESSLKPRVRFNMEKVFEKTLELFRL